MIQFQILNGKRAGTALRARRFPVRIGRSGAAEMCLDDPGVWENHLQINLRSDRAVEAVVCEPAIATVNGQPLHEAVLHNGDIIEMGSVRIRFGLRPATQRSQRLRETLTWVALAVLSFGQVVLIYWLG
ncbi:MAG TPA: FHA domain-containing protein, partial [Candidatus Sulfotelmatobacter sp.]|nr:FHA domain-containing protein [Candidatus Sulfotelmatobacter sp.]